jgi:hypothetical protein
MRRDPARGERSGDMKRLRHWLFNFAATVSLALCVATTVLWVRSHSVSDKFYYSRYFSGADDKKESAWWLLLGAGGMGVEHRWQNIRGRPRAEWPKPEFVWQKSPPSYPLLGVQGKTVWNRWGFSYRDDPWSMGPDADGYNARLLAPFWSILAPTLLLPGLWLYFRLMSKQPNPGCCQKCGYDLRATPDRCPECGAIPPAPKGATT